MNRQVGTALIGRSSTAVAYKALHLRHEGTADVQSFGPLLSVITKNGGKADLRLAGGSKANLELISLQAGARESVWIACAALEYVFSTCAELSSLVLTGDLWTAILPDLIPFGLVVDGQGSERRPRIQAGMFWQNPSIWMRDQGFVYPRIDVFNGKTEHPLRPAKPSGRVYARTIPWLSGTIAFDVATLTDLPLFHRWMNMPRVNEFWREAGNEDDHTCYLHRMIADPHVIPLIGRFDDEAFSYFEVYWAKEDVIGPYCKAADYDRGCHVIVGEDAFRGKPWFTAWLPSLLHLMFLSDPRTETIVQEPAANHHRQLRNLQRSGFAHLRTVDLPDKRAAIMSITRQHFFSSQLWHPVETV